MVSYLRRLQSGQITCYLNRTYHVLTTIFQILLDKSCALIYRSFRFYKEREPRGLVILCNLPV